MAIYKNREVTILRTEVSAQPAKVVIQYSEPGMDTEIVDENRVEYTQEELEAKAKEDKAAIDQRIADLAAKKKADEAQAKADAKADAEYKAKK